MQLTQQAIDELKAEVTRAMDAEPQGVFPGAIPTATICANKELILGFLQALVALIPGVFGKIAGQAVIAAAQAWFAKTCP